MEIVIRKNPCPPPPPLPTLNTKEGGATLPPYKTNSSSLTFSVG
jgi:hypothetical protein